MSKILITGSLGQIGSELANALCERYGTSNVVVSDVRAKTVDDQISDCECAVLDVTDVTQIAELVKKHNIKIIYHLAALLSAVAEAKPQTAWNVNMNGLYNVLEVAREFACAVFTPSSIGAFGLSTPHDKTPQDTIQRPNTMYGVTKVAGELLCDYYYKRFGVDTRGLRYPGIISYKTLPGGGTTDYAVEIYYEAIKKKKYTCFLKPGTYLDMMYMPDAINAVINLMEADQKKLIHRNAFNVTAMSIDPEKLAGSIRKQIPDFSIDYKIDPVRQGIADSWPNSMDDSAAREEWGWQPKYNLEKMTEDMLTQLRKKLA
ncbi:L-threonine 3-dehydrogenase [bacterium]|nr:L-threonine 3-dehydrogenase [bacterium]MBU1064562.1 L-threonine 3-dehydrogenase [bacterium]MBU1634418.1 L-threonine 3-dehydrogenase [bacterium]MBU1874631.1 L-threonine 3-dehydrogenase [bacterium]